MKSAFASIILLAMLSLEMTGGARICAAAPYNQPLIDQATIAAESWLKLVDSGNYQVSYDQASSLFKNAVTEAQWAEQVGVVRRPLGPLESRKVRHAQYATTLPGAPDGQYVVIQYRSSFRNKQLAIETVTPMLDKDGQWRVSGYYIK
jgi:hypothetical protein